MQSQSLQKNFNSWSMWSWHLVSLFSKIWRFSTVKSLESITLWFLMNMQWLVRHSWQKERLQSTQYHRASEWPSETEQVFSPSTSFKTSIILECSRLGLSCSTNSNSDSKVSVEHLGHLKTFTLLFSSPLISSACRLIQILQNVWKHRRVFGSVNVSLHKKHWTSNLRFLRRSSMFVRYTDATSVFRLFG
jgi:hypothetical protein